MPTSNDQALAHARMQFLSDHRQAAFGAVSRDGTLGLDISARRAPARQKAEATR
ncbi:hypothetical protein [Streptomyces sp. XD-27]|uniref:hypothetical protein n=1 Tax=Streptomyces sp. XD-27 TaxID=3062779 RepID=UPI0026F42E1C|nr:hypothetical protein [Streptomyces sp. XD-27]WKX69939.1 hypothetical protein Q3Y56_08455 [Streptomyces sp. XD-27]